MAFDQVLLVGKDAGEVLTGTPFVAGARVLGVIDRDRQGEEDPRLQEEAPQAVPPDPGPPQPLTRVRITDIQA